MGVRQNSLFEENVVMTAVLKPLALVESPSGRHCEWKAIFSNSDPETSSGR
jgi:hypothetical protein